jgi:pyridoxal 5'-phosphate synthase pdxT subunit
VKVGVLALQGDVREHAAALENLGHDVTLVKRPEHFEGLVAMVLPGGESTTLSMLLDSSGVRAPLQAWVQSNRPTFGTCAGLVMLASAVEDGRSDQKTMAGLGITARRNGYGRQRFSFETYAAMPTLGDPMEAVFIRAPRITAVADDTEVLATIETDQGTEPVAVRRGNVIACSFHPELTDDTRLHALLMEMARSANGAEDH